MKIELQNRQQRARAVYRGIASFYCLLCISLVILYAIRHDAYHLSVSLGALAFPIALPLVWKLPFLKRVWSLDCLILGFVFLAYPLGSCVDLFYWLPGYDKVAHTLSGTFVSLLALILYYCLKPGHAIGRRDKALATAFMILASIAVAGLWEIGEYALAGVVGRDLQRVAATGVADSMQDMIVCTLGTIAAIPVSLRLSDGKKGVLSNMVKDTICLHFGEQTETQGV